jgi:hypothetical protein
MVILESLFILTPYLRSLYVSVIFPDLGLSEAFMKFFSMGLRTHWMPDIYYRGRLLR